MVCFRTLTISRRDPGRADFRSEPYFLFVGTFSPRKNLETLIRALAKARDHVRESLLIVAYPDKWSTGNLRLAEELGLGNRIVHMCGLTNQEMSFVYGHATALFLLSEYEGFGFPALEAMLAGTPAVVSDSTALAEVVGDAALKINAHDVDAAAKAMLDFLPTRHTGKGYDDRACSGHAHLPGRAPARR